LAERRAVQVVPATFWLPIGDVAAWERAQSEDLARVLTGR
jgi:hypothetical protein